MNKAAPPQLKPPAFETRKSTMFDCNDFKFRFQHRSPFFPTIWISVCYPAYSIFDIFSMFLQILHLLPSIVSESHNVHVVSVCRFQAISNLGISYSHPHHTSRIWGLTTPGDTKFFSPSTSPWLSKPSY